MTDAEQTNKYRVICDAPPGHDGPFGGRFVELEDAAGKSVSADWKQRSDGLWELVIPQDRRPTPTPGGVRREEVEAICRREGVFGRQARDVTSAILARIQPARSSDEARLREALERLADEVAAVKGLSPHPDEELGYCEISVEDAEEILAALRAPADPSMDGEAG